MKLVSWNVNGLRAVHKKGHWDAFVREAAADVLCLQETKAEPEQLAQELREIPQHYGYFSTSKVRKGYSGTAIYSKIPFTEPLYGMGIPRFDDEGRMVGGRVEAAGLSFLLLNIYFPNGGRRERLPYKLEFYDAFLEFIEAQRAAGSPIVFCGDLNVAHEEIDLARPNENRNSSGFLPEERAWFEQLMDLGYVDVWRHQHPHKKDAYTYWDNYTFARERNVGWRIDYFIISPELLPRVKKADILPGVLGSDHCPVTLELV